MPKCYFIANVNSKAFDTIKSNATVHKYIPKEEDIKLLKVKNYE